MGLGSVPGKHSDLKDWAYDVIKEAILAFQFAPGVQLHIQELAKQMDISRTPIREALLRLENDGLVRAVPRVGFFVTEITRSDLRELFELRGLLEGYAAQEAASLLSDDDLAHMDRLFENSVSAVERGELKEFLEAETALHTFLIEHCGNSRLIQVMESLKDLTYRERILSIESLDNVRESCVEHQAILDALHKRDGALAGERMRVHIRNVKRRLLQFPDIPQ